MRASAKAAGMPVVDDWTELPLADVKRRLVERGALEANAAPFSAQQLRFALQRIARVHFEKGREDINALLFIDEAVREMKQADMRLVFQNRTAPLFLALHERLNAQISVAVGEHYLDASADEDEDEPRPDWRAASREALVDMQTRLLELIDVVVMEHRERCRLVKAVFAKLDESDALAELEERLEAPVRSAASRP